MRQAICEKNRFLWLLLVLLIANQSELIVESHSPFIKYCLISITIFLQNHLLLL